jgi:hypothetical protein
MKNCGDGFRYLVPLDETYLDPCLIDYRSVKARHGVKLSL